VQYGNGSTGRDTLNHSMLCKLAIINSQSINEEDVGASEAELIRQPFLNKAPFYDLK
jgi:hypothetical protein